MLPAASVGEPGPVRRYDLPNQTHPLELHTPAAPPGRLRQGTFQGDGRSETFDSFRLRKSALMIFFFLAFLIIGIVQQAALQVNSGFSEFRLLLNAVWR